MKEIRQFPQTIKKGDIITHPEDGVTYVVVKTPSEIKSMSCEVKDANGKRYWQFAYKGILINGKALA